MINEHDTLTCINNQTINAILSDLPQVDQFL